MNFKMCWRWNDDKHRAIWKKSLVGPCYGAPTPKLDQLRGTKAIRLLKENKNAQKKTGNNKSSSKNKKTNRSSTDLFIFSSARCLSSHRTKWRQNHLKFITTSRNFRRGTKIYRSWKRWQKIDQNLIKNWSKIDQKSIKNLSKNRLKKVVEKSTKKSSKNRPKIDQKIVKKSIKNSSKTRRVLGPRIFFKKGGGRNSKVEKFWGGVPEIFGGGSKNEKSSKNRSIRVEGGEKTPVVFAARNWKKTLQVRELVRNRFLDDFSSIFRLRGGQKSDDFSSPKKTSLGVYSIFPRNGFWSIFDQKSLQKSCRKPCPKKVSKKWRKNDEKIVKKSIKNRSIFRHFFRHEFWRDFWDDFWSNFWSIFDQILINFRKVLQKFMTKVSSRSWQSLWQDFLSWHRKDVVTKFVDKCFDRHHFDVVESFIIVRFSWDENLTMLSCIFCKIV